MYGFVPGLAREHLRRFAQAGHLQQIERGIYLLPAVDRSERSPLVEVAGRVQAGVVCLHSALAFHHLTTQAPGEVWLALERDTYKLCVTRWPLHIARFSGLAWTSGVQTQQVEGVPIQVYSPAKTVADCFKFRSKLGLHVSIVALRGERR